MMSCSDTLYLEGKANVDELHVSVETFITLFILSYSENSCFKITFVDTLGAFPCIVPKTSVAKLRTECVDKDLEALKGIHTYLPAVQTDNKVFIAGLCSVLRWTFKVLLQNYPDHPCQNILGFRNGCLVACSESSVWTKFCEVELPETVKHTFALISESETCSSIPLNLTKLEAHLKRPVRTHNILKRKLDLAKNMKEMLVTKQMEGKKVADQVDIDFTIYNSRGSTVENLEELLKQVKITEANNDFDLEHCYLEGIDLTLADLVVLPCVHLLLESLPSSYSVSLPKVEKWYLKMLSNTAVLRAAEMCGWSKLKLESQCGDKSLINNIAFPDCEEYSLYSRDPHRPKFKCRNVDPSSVVNTLKESGIVPCYDNSESNGLDWNSLPSMLHPANGDLPKNRMARKCQQLESIVLAVLKLASPGQAVVDFCSGGGHVGLLLAHYLPKCKVMLVENKEASMQRAQKRAEALNLKNVEFFQCNLDYFKSAFDIGVSLHACGVATDLVIQKCIEQKASFVCCPCCYGSIQETYLLKYPLSQSFRISGITYQDFMLLAHCADRTEVNTPREQQGNYCMGLVDTDRLLYVKEQGYNVTLSTLKPPTCSPKHNLLIGSVHT